MEKINTPDVRKTILVIDDQPRNLQLAAHVLNPFYELILATSGEKGLRIASEKLPDLILLDIIMPKLGGFEVMEEINKDPSLKKIPIIIVSNSGQPVELDRAQKLGAKDWLIKTEFDPKEVIDKVVKQIGK